MEAMLRAALGALGGAAAGAVIAPLIRGFFSVPGGGVGWVTVHRYPKGFDYAVIALLMIGSTIGAWIWSRGNGAPASAGPVPAKAGAPFAAIVFVLMLFIHDHPYSLMDPFHEGEYLTPAFLLMDGGRPFRDVFFFHGLATDGGLDSLILGHPPSPKHERRLETLLDAATLALLVPIAAEVCVSVGGVVIAVIASLCAIGAFEVPVFPWFRLAPILIATLALLRYARTRNYVWLIVAFCASTLGLLWSVDVGVYAVAATLIIAIWLRAPLKYALIAIPLPFLVLLALRADIRNFVVDSFITIPSAADANASLPARMTIDLESVRYYFPPIFYGWLLAMGIRTRDRRMMIIAIVSMILFRTPAGRCSWSHLRFGIPLLGIALVAFVLEPMRRRIVAAVVVAIALAFYVDLFLSAEYGWKFLATWRDRQSHAGLVPYPVPTGRGIYTTAQNASDLAQLNGLLSVAAPPGAPILDLSNELAIYYLMQRHPAIRCPSVPMLAAPRLTQEALRELDANPPACVILEGMKELDGFDGVSNRERVPALFAWAEGHYPRRTRAGRFVVATK